MPKKPQANEVTPDDLDPLAEATPNKAEKPKKRRPRAQSGKTLGEVFLAEETARREDAATLRSALVSMPGFPIPLSVSVNADERKIVLSFLASEHADQEDRVRRVMGRAGFGVVDWAKSPEGDRVLYRFSWVRKTGSA